jgi:hypothetical protein
MNNHNKNTQPLALTQGPALIPVVSGHLNEQRQRLVDARQLHRFLDVRSKVKALTGGDKVSARFVRKDFFEYVPQFKLVGPAVGQP